MSTCPRCGRPQVCYSHHDNETSYGSLPLVDLPPRSPIIEARARRFSVPETKVEKEDKKKAAQKSNGNVDQVCLDPRASSSLPFSLQALRTSDGWDYADVCCRVRTLTGKEIELDIEPDYKVSQIKEKVEEKEGIPPVQQRLIFGGKQMVDDKTAAEYNLEGGATLHLVLALRGGF